MRSILDLNSTTEETAAEEDENNYAVVPPPPTPLLPCHIAEASVDAGVRRFTWPTTSCLLRPPAVGNTVGASKKKKKANDTFLKVGTARLLSMKPLLKLHFESNKVKPVFCPGILSRSKLISQYHEAVKTSPSQLSPLTLPRHNANTTLLTLARKQLSRTMTAATAPQTRHKEA